MKHLLTSIVSGGAVGAERGAMRAAVDMDLNFGGWQWHQDDVPEIYEVRMRSAITRAMQRRLNVQDSDATLFVMRHGSKEMKFIVDACKSMRKPAKTLYLHDGHGARLDWETVHQPLLAWIEERRISVLNVVGDADEEDTRDALCWLLDGHVVADRPSINMADATGEPMNGFDAAEELARIKSTQKSSRYTPDKLHHSMMRAPDVFRMAGDDGDLADSSIEEDERTP